MSGAEACDLRVFSIRCGHCDKVENLVYRHEEVGRSEPLPQDCL
jgi:hypothetical protein